MSKRILLISLLVIGFIFLASSLAVAQTLPSGYDEDEEEISRSEEGAGTTFVQDLEEIRRRRINDIIQKIRQGDPNVLRFIVYDVFEEVHREVIRRARESESNYYEVIGMREAIPAYIGGFDNQDPKVRLRCIGWLGDWVDEIGLDLADIQKRTRDRIVSRIETRDEVRFAFRLLDLKIVRKTILNKIYSGNERILQDITASEFIVLIHDEIFLREAYCIDPRIRIRSIRLAPWWIDVKVLNAVVAHRLSYTRRLSPMAFNRIYNRDFEENPFIVASSGGVVSDHFLNLDEERAFKQTDVDTLILPVIDNVQEGYREKIADNLGYNIEVAATDRAAAAQNDMVPGRKFEYLSTYYIKDSSAFSYIGYRDHALNWDIQTLYDIRYFNYSETGQEFTNEDKFVRALFGGLVNRHLVVRENVARILIMLSDPFIRVDYTGTVVGVNGVINELARDSKYVEWAIKAWEEVRYSQYIDVTRPAEFMRADGRRAVDTADAADVRYYHLDGNKLNYGLSEQWGYLWNYRIDMHELLRRMGLGQLFQCDIQTTATAPAPRRPTGRDTYFVESLFDLTEIDVLPDDTGTNYDIWNLIPSWHGVDEIEDEVFNPRP